MRYKGLDLNLLFALDALLETRSVSRVAEQLSLSQSAVSAALKRLRDYFGDELLILDGRRMHPTPFAEQLSAHLRTYLEATDTVLQTSRNFDPRTSQRVFKIVVSDYVITAVLVRLAQNLSRTAPGLRLDFIPPDETAQSRLARGEVDMMISPREFLLTDHPVELLYEEPFVIAGWDRNPIFTGQITTETVLAAGHVAVAIGSHRDSTFADRHMAQMTGRRIAAVASSFGVVPWMLCDTDWLSVMHRRLAVAVSRFMPIAFAPLPFEFPVMAEMVQIHRAQAGDLGNRWLIDQIRGVAAIS